MQTEKEFLSTYNMEKYERPSVTTDIVALMFRPEESEEKTYRKDREKKLSILLMKREQHPFIGKWALPGGFLKSTETVEDCAVRNIKEKTNVTPTALIPVGVFSDRGRDPRGWILSNAYLSIIQSDNIHKITQNPYYEAKWFGVTFKNTKENRYRLTLESNGTTISSEVVYKGMKYGRPEFKTAENKDLAFDHLEIMATALMMLKIKAKDINIVFDFLPEKFTISELQKAQEALTGTVLLSANFRRKANEYITETKESTQGAGHRPAKLFKKK